MVTVTLKCGDSQHQIDVDPADGVEVRTPLLQCVLSQLGFQALLPRKWTDSLSHSEPKQQRETRLPATGTLPAHPPPVEADAPPHILGERGAAIRGSSTKEKSGRVP